jgi:hypothetical protein
VTYLNAILSLAAREPDPLSQDELEAAASALVLIRDKLTKLLKPCDCMSCRLNRLMKAPPEEQGALAREMFGDETKVDITRIRP